MRVSWAALKVVTVVQDALAGVIGVTPEDRVHVLDGMLRRRPTDTAGYWLQLVLSMGIATLGLAMGSTAVVIGAMLISPLMGPLIELGMGLATGSLLLSIRAVLRTGASVLVVVLGAAGVTRLLPFHEITPELAARTSPTMIDLFVAVCCALAGVYTTVRQGKDVISAAAGTAIGISLVPPLCTAGYGLGVANVEVFRGALLLFTANFAAITAVTSFTVVLLGFGQIDSSAIEDEVLARPDGKILSFRAARLTRRAVGRPLGALTRLLIPALLLGAIILPLKRALEEVSWQVRVRSQVEDMLAKVPGAVVRQSLEVRGGIVRVRLLLVGSDAEAREVARDLRVRIAAISGHEPLVEVIAVPDAAALDAMALQLQAAARPAPTPTPPPEPPPAAETFTAALDHAVAAHWPAAAGAIVRLRIVPQGGGLAVEVTHLGTPLGDAGVELLEQAWTAALEVPVDVVDRAVPAAPLEATADGGEAWLPEALRRIDLAGDIPTLHACVTVPAPPASRGRRAPAPSPSIATVRAVVEAALAGRSDVPITEGAGWSLRVGVEPCAEASPPPAPGAPRTTP